MRAAWRERERERDFSSAMFERRFFLRTRAGFSESHVERPVQRVLDAPVASDRRGQLRPDRWLEVM